MRNILELENLWINIKTISFTRFLLLVLVGLFLALVLTGSIGGAEWTWKRVTFLVLSMCALLISLVATEHYLQVHIWGHIIKKHLLRVFLWTFGALLFVNWGLSFWSLDAFIHQHMVWILLIAALIGIIPESGPHLFFVMMYVQGLIPFSVLFTSSFVQDGHGILPLLSYSIRDAVLIKVANVAFGLAVGIILFSFRL